MDVFRTIYMVQKEGPDTVMGKGPEDTAQNTISLCPFWDHGLSLHGPHEGLDSLKYVGSKKRSPFKVVVYKKKCD